MAAGVVEGVVDGVVNGVDLAVDEAVLSSMAFNVEGSIISSLPKLVHKATKLVGHCNCRQSENFFHFFSIAHINVSKGGKPDGNLRFGQTEPSL